MQLNSDQWHAFQQDLRERVGVDDFNSWLQPLTYDPSASTSSHVTLTVPTEFMQDWIQNNFQDDITAALHKTVAPDVAVSYKVAALFSPTGAASIMTSRPDVDGAKVVAPATPPATASNTSAQPILESHESRIDPRYRFETFVTGKSNQFAFAAAQRIAESQDLAYNPFFLYGGVGLGKTHLMHAIGWYIKENYPERKVLYISAEQFLYRFIRALKDRSTLSFKETFRSVDVLMIDDIQFIAGKEATQEEFFHTFNALVSMQKQIILTADRAPHDMANVEDRLRSRLGHGLATEIHVPDVETRLAILQKKAEELKIDLAPELGMLLANGIASNIRELEGALNRLAAHAKFIDAELTVEFAQEQLKDLFRANIKLLSVEDIQHKVAEYYNIKMMELLGTRRSRAVARPRQLAMYFAKQLTTKSYPEIGRSFGGKDHTTVMHAVRTIENLMTRDAQLAEDIRLLEKMLK